MLRTNTKKVTERMMEHISNYYEDINDLRSDLEAVGTPRTITTYNKACALVEGGCFLIYNGDIADFLKDILEESDEEANKYDYMQSFNLYKHLIAKAVEKMVK